MPTNEHGLPHYIQSRTDSLVAVEENNRKAVFANPQRTAIHVVQVDGGMVTQGERADYVVAKPSMIDVIVELKGSDVSKAIEQLRATLPLWKQSDYAGDKYGLLVVCGKGIHPKARASHDRWKREFRKQRMKLLIETTNRTYEFDEFL